MLIWFRRFITLALLSPALASAGWTLDAERSSLGYISTKMVAGSHKTVFEHNRFAGLSGGVADDGAAAVTIALDTLDTGVEIRDQRVLEHVFSAAKHPRARLAAKIDPRLLDGLKPGESRVLDIEVELQLAGKSGKVKTQAAVARLDDRTLLVRDATPALFDAAAFGLADGFEILRKLVGLFNIPTTIPVTFQLVFTR